jgi:LuxR family maltose regulon positive regulatory protein
MIAFMQLVSASLNLGRLNEAYDYARYVYDAVDTETTTGQNLYVGAAQLLSIILRNKGQYYQAFQLTEHSIEVVKSRAVGFFPMIGLLYSEFGRIHYEWNEVDKAAEYCRRTIELGQRTGISDLLFASYYLDTQLARKEGDLKRLTKRLKWFKEITSHTKMDEMIQIAHYIEAAFRLEIGDLTSAVRWANGSGYHFDDEPTYEQFGQYHTLVRIYLAESQHQPNNKAQLLARAGRLIDRLQTVIQPTDDVMALVELSILEAIQFKMQASPAAAAEMNRAIIQAEPGTMIRTFLDNGPIVHALIQEVALAENNTAEHAAYIQRLLRACEGEWGTTGAVSDQYATSLIQPLADPLTEREREVLACITAGLSNREIEERLVITRNTVRTHIKNLYSKLGVNGRDEAVEQAQVLGLN